MPIVLTAILTTLLSSTTATALRSLQLEPRWTLTHRQLEVLSGLGAIRCDVTVTKTVSGVVPKVEGILIGRVTDVRTGNCRGSFGIENIILEPLGIEADNTTLWRLFYKAFGGSLPEIAGLRIRIEHVQFLMTAIVFQRLVTCLFEGSIEVQATVTGGIIGRLTTLREARRLTLTNALLNTATCPREAEVLAEAWEPVGRPGVRLL